MEAIDIYGIQQQRIIEPEEDGAVCLTGGSESGHVFHLHGYSFHVVGVTQLDRPTPLPRIQQLDSRDSLLTRNLLSPVLKDTVAVPSNGVAVLRFKADNPGKVTSYLKNSH
jgi:FtsP/CotA-like multicopper oxidase with cupredoxin domain